MSTVLDIRSPGIFIYWLQVCTRKQQIPQFSHLPSSGNLHSTVFTSLGFFLINFLNILFIYLFLERGEGKEKERERNINVWLPLTCPILQTWPTAQACTMTGNQTHDPLVHSPVLNPLSHTSQGKFSFFLVFTYKQYHTAGVPNVPAADWYQSAACWEPGSTAGGKLECNALESSRHHPHHSRGWKNCLPQNQSLAPKRLGTAVVQYLSFSV